MLKLYLSWSNGEKKGSVILPVRREYISKKTIVNAKTKDTERSSYWVTEILCKLVKEQSAPQVGYETFHENPLENTYFM